MVPTKEIKFNSYLEKIGAQAQQKFIDNERNKIAFDIVELFNAKKIINKADIQGIIDAHNTKLKDYGIDENVVFNFTIHEDDDTIRISWSDLMPPPTITTVDFKSTPRQTTVEFQSALQQEVFVREDEWHNGITYIVDDEDSYIESYRCYVDNDVINFEVIQKEECERYGKTETAEIPAHVMRKFMPFINNYFNRDSS